MVILLSEKQKRLKNSFLRRVDSTRGTTQIAAMAATSDSNKSYPLTRANGKTWRRSARLTGSEVMGIQAPNRRLSPTVDSLKIRNQAVFVTAFFDLTLIYHTFYQMSNTFFI